MGWGAIMIFIPFGILYPMITMSLSASLRQPCGHQGDSVQDKCMSQDDSQMMTAILDVSENTLLSQTDK